MKKTVKKKAKTTTVTETKSKEVEKNLETLEQKENPENETVDTVETVETVQESTVDNNSQVSDKKTACDSCEIEEDFDFVQVKVKGNEYSVVSQGFTKEQEKAIAMTIFQMRNKFELGTNFSANIRRR